MCEVKSLSPPGAGEEKLVPSGKSMKVLRGNVV